MLAGKQILVLEDETLLRKGLCRFLEEDQRAETFAAGSLEEARNLLGSIHPDFALLDIHLPDGNSLDLLKDPGFPETTVVVVMTAQGGIATAIDAIKRGARDYLSKPVEPEALPVLFQRLEKESSRRRIDQYREEKRASLHKGLFVGKRLEAIRGQLDKILQADRRLQTNLPPVLIEGETGTGKSTLARWLHQNGPRGGEALIEINCSTLPESLAESELFGHEKGAFTDARQERMGLFEAAAGGTLFLDEIASLPLSLQAKVLTAIEDKQIRRLGGNRSRPIDVRLVTASLLPLRELVAEGRFREDLYHRLNLLPLGLPPLREYPGDLPDLADHVLADLRRRYQQPDLVLTDRARERLLRYHWPGNVRELMHELERSLIFSDSGRIELDHLPGPSSSPSTEAAAPDLLNPAWRLPASGFRFEDELHRLTETVLHRALESENGNISAAARRLGVSRDFLRYRLQQSGG